jgi:hypothetical protein
MASKTALFLTPGVAGVYGVTAQIEARDNGLAGHLVLWNS